MFIISGSDEILGMSSLAVLTLASTTRLHKAFQLRSDALPRMELLSLG
jgi:hypothetical protein